jgi:hypothetical protein
LLLVDVRGRELGLLVRPVVLSASLLVDVRRQELGIENPDPSSAFSVEVALSTLTT